MLKKYVSYILNKKYMKDQKYIKNIRIYQKCISYLSILMPCCLTLKIDRLSYAVLNIAAPCMHGVK